jgi:ATP adenylyltransferase/5',5'''-P-1,P-4-tetraphosphate phosphorylase II
MSYFQHGWGDSRSNESKAFSVLATREAFAMVPLSTGGDGEKLEHVDKGFHEGILLAR